MEKGASLRPIDFVDVKPVKAKKIRTIANAKTKKSNDKFASIKVSEGEEVLVSSSDSIEKTVKKDVSEKTVASVENLDISSPVSNKEEIKANDSKKSNAKKSTKSKKQKATETIAKAKSSSLSSTDTNEKSVAKNDVANDINADSSDVVSKESDDSLDDNPFGVIVSKTKKSDKKKKDIDVAANSNPFVKAFSAIKPETNKKATSSKKSSSEKSTKGKKKSSVASAEIIKKDLRRAYLSGNQYLSAYEDEEESSSEDENEEALEEDVDEEVEEQEEENEEEYEDDEGFKKQKDVEDALEGKGDKKVPVEKVDIKDVKKKLQDTKKAIVAPSGPLKAGTREVLQMKIDFQEGSSAVSGESVNLIRSFAQIATEQPTNSIEITIPEIVMNNPKKKKLTARRLSIVSNILRNAGISDRQILPVLSDRDEDSFAFRVVRNDAYTTLRISKGKDIFGEEENVKEYNIMKW